jgi:hypothetical protein
MSVFWLKHSGQNEPHNYPRRDFMLDVWLRGDSGNGHNGYPSSPAETSESLLYIHVICCKTPDAGRQNWYDLWCNMDYADNGDVQPVKGHEGFVMCLEKINMVSLEDQKTFSACWMHLNKVFLRSWASISVKQCYRLLLFAPHQQWLLYCIQIPASSFHGEPFSAEC